MMKAFVLVALLLAVQGCSARKLHEDPVLSAARAKGSGTDTAGAAAGGSVDAATKTAIGGASATASGTEVESELEIVNDTGVSSGSVRTGGSAKGSKGASITSIGQVNTKPNSATSIGFTNGAAFGEGAELQTATETSATTPWGTATSQAQIFVASDIGFNREGRYGNALSTAATVGGYGPGSGPGKFSATTTANTEIDGLYAKSDGTALFTAPYGRVSVIVQDSARPNPTILG